MRLVLGPLLNHTTFLEENNLACLKQSLKFWLVAYKAHWLPPEADFSVTAKHPFNSATDVHAYLLLMLMWEAHGHQEESKPDCGRMKCSRISMLEQCYSMASAAPSNVISVMNGGVKPSIQLLSHACSLIILSSYCFSSSSASEMFLKLNVKTVKAVPKYRDHSNWSIQQTHC